MDGYFWISYEDACLGKPTATAVIYDVDTTLYDNCYSYVKQVASGKGQNYWSKTDRLTIKQSFHVDQGETIKAAGLVLDSSDVTTEIIVTNGVHTAGKLFKTTLPGYYSTELECPFEITKAGGEDVTVTVYYRGNNLKVHIEEEGTERLADVAIGTKIQSRGINVNGNDDPTSESMVRLFTNNTGKVTPAPSNLLELKQKSVYLAPAGSSGKQTVEMSSDCGYAAAEDQYYLEWVIEDDLRFDFALAKC